METEVKVIELSKTPEECVSLYFKDTIMGLKKYSSYKESDGTLDYFLTRRILATMFNNMRELDLEFVSGELYEIYKSLKEMASVYTQFESKTAHQALAYDNVFLEQQIGYKKIRKENDVLDMEASNMASKESSLKNEIEAKNAELKNPKIPKKVYEETLKEIKHLKGQQVDLIHKTAVAKEQIEVNLKLMEAFKERYQDEFSTIFKNKVEIFNAKAISILNAMAYSFDRTLWKYAKKSKQIRKFFKNAQIKGEFCSSTYMKYYLSNLDRGKMSQEQVDLQKLYEYLKEKDGAYIMVLSKSVEKSVDIKITLEATTLDYRIKVFQDEAKSMHFAKKHYIALIILEEKLEKLTAQQYINAYKIRVDDDIKTLVISDNEKENLEYSATLSTNYLRSELIEAVKSLVH